MVAKNDVLSVTTIIVMEIFMRNDARDRVLFVMLLGEDITISIIVAFIITPNPITTVVMTLLSL